MIYKFLFYPPASEASRVVANLTERKKSANTWIWCQRICLCQYSNFSTILDSLLPFWPQSFPIRQNWLIILPSINLIKHSTNQSILSKNYWNEWVSEKNYHYRIEAVNLIGYPELPKVSTHTRSFQYYPQFTTTPLLA